MDPTLITCVQAMPFTAKDMAICRLYKSNSDEWRYTDAWGALFLYAEDSVPFLRLVDVETKDTLWECELYADVNFQKHSKHFCSFEGEEVVWGLSFADKFDSTQFADSVTRATVSKKKKSKPKKSGGLFKSITNSIKTFVGKDDDRRMKDVQISKVSNFERSMHIGFEPGKGFVYENLPAEWKKLFADAGIKKEQLQDKDTAKTLFKTMKKFEKKQTKTGGKPAPPSRGQRSKPAPPPPKKKRSPAPPRKAPPPGKAPPPPSGGPPPPPPPSGGGPPPPPPPSSGGSSSGDASVGKVTKGQAPPPQPGRGDLMAQIRAGTKLKKVEESEKNKKEIDLDLNEMSAAGKNDLMSMLKQSLSKRADAIQSDSDDSDWSDDDEDW